MLYAKKRTLSEPKKTRIYLSTPDALLHKLFRFNTPLLQVNCEKNVNWVIEVKS